MLGGKTMECTFAQKGIGAGQVEMKMQSQGKKFRSSYTANGETFVSVSDGEVIYAWSTKNNTGTKMDIACMKSLADSIPQAKNAVGDQANPKDPEALVDEKPDMHCTPIASVDFSVPSDVKFTDTCAQMKKAFESMKNLNLPQGVNIPAAE